MSIYFFFCVFHINRNKKKIAKKREPQLFWLWREEQECVYIKLREKERWRKMKKTVICNYQLYTEITIDNHKFVL